MQIMSDSSSTRGKPIKILVLNPNSSQSMTDGLQPVIDSIDIPSSTTIATCTGPPTAPASINDAVDIVASHNLVLEEVVNGRLSLDGYDGIVVACFSVHPLVGTLRTLRGAPAARAVTGIFEASVTAALGLLQPSSPHSSQSSSAKSQWGIVTTGTFWVEHLTQGVADFLGTPPASSSTTTAAAAGAVSTHFAGVESTGLNAGDFHAGVGPEEVERRLREATCRLLARGDDVRCIVMGCAGMAGLEAVIRRAACEARGPAFAYDELHVVDGVRAAVLQAEELVKHLRWREGARARFGQELAE